MPKPTIRIRSWGLLIAAPLLAALQVAAPTPVVMMALIVVMGLLAGSLAWVLGLQRALEASRSRSRDWAQAGETFEEAFAVTNAFWLPAPWVEISNANDVPGYDVRRAMGVPAGQAVHWMTQMLCSQRGVYTLGPTRVRSGDPFGLFEVELVSQGQETFYVYPAVAEIPLIEPLAGGLAGSARSRRCALTQTVNVDGIRGYAPGDPFRHIHWRATAHRSTSGADKIMIKEFEPEAQADFWIVLDLDSDAHWGSGETSSEEYGVTLAASLAQTLLARGRAVGLVAHGAEPLVLPPRRDRGHLDEILRGLAGVHADTPAPLARVLDEYGRRMRSGAHCAVITPSTAPAWTVSLQHLQSRSIQPLAYLLAARVPASSDEMRQAADGLAAIGVPHLVLDEAFYRRLLPQTPPMSRGTAEAPPTPSDASDLAPWTGASSLKERAL
jgi:uncharacterized protein (DUF58 family)